MVEMPELSIFDKVDWELWYTECNNNTARQQTKNRKKAGSRIRWNRRRERESRLAVPQFGTKIEVIAHSDGRFLDEVYELAP